MLRYDESCALDGAILRAFDVIAEESTLSGRHWEHAQRLRLYPLVLALFSLAYASVERGLVFRAVELLLDDDQPRERKHSEPCAVDFEPIPVGEQMSTQGSPSNLNGGL